MFKKSIKSIASAKLSVETDVNQKVAQTAKKIVANIDFAFSESTFSSLVVKDETLASNSFRDCNLKNVYLELIHDEDDDFFLMFVDELRKGEHLTEVVCSVNNIDNIGNDFLCMLVEEDDIKCRSDTHRWLNDNLINSYCELLSHSLGTSNDTIILSSFFYSKITEDGKYNFINGKKFTYHVNIFEKKVILVPVFVKANHWAVLAVYLELNTIFYIDSLQFDGTRHLKFMLNWIFDEYNNIYSSFMSLSAWKLVNSKSFLEKTQNNSFDCGVRCLMNLEHLARGFTLPGGDENEATKYRLQIGVSVLLHDLKPKNVVEYEVYDEPMDVEGDDLLGCVRKNSDTDGETVSSNKSVKTRSSNKDSPGPDIELQDGSIFDIKFNRKEFTYNWKCLVNYLNILYLLQVDKVSGGVHNTCLYTSINKGLIRNNRGRGVPPEFKDGDVVLKRQLRQYMITNERAITKQYCEAFLEPIFEPLLGEDGHPIYDDSYKDRLVALTKHKTQVLEIDGFVFVNMAGELEEELVFNLRGDFVYANWVDQTLQLFGNEPVLRCLCSMLNVNIVVFAHNIVFKNTPVADQNLLAVWDRREILVDPAHPVPINIPIVYNGWDHYDAAMPIPEKDLKKYAKDLNALGIATQEDLRSTDFSPLLLRKSPLVKDM
jgi:hypothetical protein